MVVRTNIFSLNTHRNLKNVGLHKVRSANRLSSGFRINSAADDAAGLAISENMRAQIRGLDQAQRNVQDAIALVQTAEGGMAEICNMVHRIRELVVQAANDTNVHGYQNVLRDDGTIDTRFVSTRQHIQKEINQLVQEIDSLSRRVEFNTMRLLDGYRVAMTPPQSPQWVYNHVYGGRSSAANLQSFQAQLQNSTFNTGNFLLLNVGHPGGGMGIDIDLVEGILDYFPGFENFVQNELFETDGSITRDNLQRFVGYVQNGLRLELELFENWFGVDLGSQYVFVDFDHDGHIIMGFTNNAFSIEDIIPFSASDADNFGTDFFLSFLGNTPDGPNPSGATPILRYRLPRD